VGRKSRSTHSDPIAPWRTAKPRETDFGLRQSTRHYHPIIREQASPHTAWTPRHAAVMCITTSTDSSAGILCSWLSCVTLRDRSPNTMYVISRYVIAVHLWSKLEVAFHWLPFISQQISRLGVYGISMYHDIFRFIAWYARHIAPCIRI